MTRSIHPAVLAAHAQFGGDLVDMNRRYNLPRRCETNVVGAAGECLSCDAEQGEHCRKVVSEDDCCGHVASTADPKVCGRCGIHIDSLRPDDEEAA